MTDAQPSSAQQLIGDFAPKLVSLTDDVLFGDVSERADLSPCDRSLVTGPSVSQSSAGGWPFMARWVGIVLCAS